MSLIAKHNSADLKFLHNFKSWIVDENNISNMTGIIGKTNNYTFDKYAHKALLSNARYIKEGLHK